MPMIGTFITHEKEFSAIASELQKLQDTVVNLTKQVESLKENEGNNQIRSEALLAQVFERELITQDKYDELIEMLRTIAKQKGFKV
jgi:hypothetical protein